MAGYRPPYTLSDDKAILRYIIDGNYEKATKGDNLWKKMAEDNVCNDRTWMSLKNRWNRYISCDLGRPEYKLTGDEKAMLKSYIGPTYKRQIHPGLVQKNQSKKNPVGKLKEQEEKGYYSLDMNWSDNDTE